MPAHRESRGSRLALAAWLTAVVGASAEPAAISASVGLHAAPVEANVAEAVNAPFKDRDLDVSMGAKRFEGESREVFSARFDVLDAPGLRPGLRIADIGAGTAATSRGVEGRTWSWR